MADLTTLANVRDYLRLAAGETEHDAFLARLIGEVSAYFRASCGRDIQAPAAAYTETYSGDGGSVLWLAQTPVLASPEPVLSVDGVTVSKRATVTGSGWVLDADIGRLELVGSYFTAGTRNVVVTYTAGWTAVPGDVEEAVIRLVALHFKDRDRAGLAAQMVNGQTVDFRDGGAAYAYFKAVAQSYSRIEA